MVSPRFESLVSKIKTLVDELPESLHLRFVLDRLRMLRRTAWPRLQIGDLSISVPVIQGGMGVGISLSRLASAVANVGGVGVIAAAGIGLIEKDYYKDGRAANLRAFRREIRAARAATDGAIGVNIMVALNDFHELLDVAIEEGVDLVFMGAGLPIKGLPVARMREKHVKAVPIVSSARGAQMIFRMWKKIYNDVPDALVVEGPRAGGHLGFSEEDLDADTQHLSQIVPEVVEAVKPFEADKGCPIPVIAAGGIFDGSDVYAIMARGASAVQMGTRFVATEECDADDAFKETYVAATAEDIGIIQSPVGMPGRAIRNQFIHDSEAGKRPAFRCAWQCLSSCKAEKAKYCISIALNNARKGNLKQGFAFIGANGYRIHEITTVPALIGELAAGFQEAVRLRIATRLEPIVDQLGAMRNTYDGMVRRVAQLRDELNRRLSEIYLNDAGLAR